MGMKRPLIVLISAVLLVSPLSAVAAVKAGDPCKKAGSTATLKGKKFTCVKSGKKLVWNKGVAIKKPTPTTSPSPSPSPTPTPSPSPTPTGTEKQEFPSKPTLDRNVCRVTEVGTQRQFFSKNQLKSISGFPMTQSRLPSKGTINFLAIPVDWADVPGDSNAMRESRNQLELHEEWWAMMSEGKLKINSRMHEKWIRLPGESKSYAVPFSEAYPETGEFWSKVIKTIDPYIDFTDVQVITFVFPTGQRVIPASVQELYSIGAIKDYPTQEGKPVAFIGPGYMFYQWNTNAWSYWAHEIGHLIDFAHGGSPNGNTLMSGYDMMFSQDGPLRTFSGWWRFLAGWFSDEQVYCADFRESFEYKIPIVPIDSSVNGIKLVAVRLSETKILLIESRTFSKFDNTNRTGPYQQGRPASDWSGVLAYIYDATKGHLEDFFIPLASNSALSEYNWDGQTRFMSKSGEVIEYEEMKIQITKNDEAFLIDISKLSPEEISKPRPRPSPAPSPSTSDFNIVPTAEGGGVRTGETTGLSIWHGQNYRSFRIYVVSASNPNSSPIFDTGIINDYKSPIKVELTNLTCKRDDLEVAIFYSGLDGKGLSKRVEQSHLLSKVTIDPISGKCLGNWTIAPRG
jgi:hypothetical protein